jgi:hypothetical protein
MNSARIESGYALYLVIVDKSFIDSDQWNVLLRTGEEISLRRGRAER